MGREVYIYKPYRKRINIRKQYKRSKISKILQDLGGESNNYIIALLIYILKPSNYKVIA